MAHEVTDETAPDPQPDSSADESSAPDESTATKPQLKLDKRKTIIGGIVTLIVLGLVFWGLAKKFGSFSEAWASIKEMSLISVAALIVVAIVNIIVYTFPYMPAVPGLKYRPAFMVRQTSWAIGALIPAGGAVAVAVQYLMLS